MYLLVLLYPLRESLKQPMSLAFRVWRFKILVIATISLLRAAL
jgi:hypothetical protein